ncbi:MAG TPA: flavoprotein, partial [Pirellulaceae bacterium]|nr:flavoprotein [Pirellulaceae bacterium]
MSQPIVVGITGASGAVYAIRLIEVLLNAGCEVHLAISPSGRTVIAQELNLSVDLEHFSAETLLGDILRTQTL